MRRKSTQTTTMRWCQNSTFSKFAVTKFGSGKKKLFKAQFNEKVQLQLKIRFEIIPLSLLERVKKSPMDMIEVFAKIR